MSRPLVPIEIVQSVAPLAASTGAWLVDIWGVMHDGVTPFAPACEACQVFRDAGGLVILISNSPRPRQSVAAQLDRIGVPQTAYDAIVSSGDMARTLIEAYAGRGVLHLGPERDLPIFAGIDVERVGADRADAVVCTGLVDDERETPDDYAETLAACAARGLPMICANPDLTVERGGRIIYCAGAIAQAYERLGAKVTYAGKPYLPIYELAFSTLEQLRPGASDRSRLLAIGDGVRTDLAGAAAAGVASLFVASGVHVTGTLDSEALEALFPPGAPRPIAAMKWLQW
jgi:HAD superfamily hydrolase (TIGR01459 family)